MFKVCHIELEHPVSQHNVLRILGADCIAFLVLIKRCTLLSGFETFLYISDKASNSQPGENKQPPKKRSKGPYCCVYDCHSCKGRDKIGFFKVLKSDSAQSDAWTRAIRYQSYIT